MFSAPFMQIRVCIGEVLCDCPKLWLNLNTAFLSSFFSGFNQLKVFVDILISVMEMYNKYGPFAVICIWETDVHFSRSKIWAYINICIRTWTEYVCLDNCIQSIASLTLCFRQIKVTIAKCVYVCVFVGSVVFSDRCRFFPFFYIFHARFCVNFHLLTLSQWNFSERPEKKQFARCGCVAWYGRAWHGRWCALMVVKCFEPDAQMHLHLICVTFCALDYFWMLDASVKLCFMKYSNSGSSISSWKKKRAENKSQTVSSPDFLLIGEREKRRHRLCGTTSATCLFHRSLILFSQLY